MPSSFKPNSQGLREYLLSSDLYPALEQHAVEIEARAKANASEHVDSGEYLQSIHIERDRSPSRVRVRVISDDRKAAILEARYDILGRAVG